MSSGFLADGRQSHVDALVAAYRSLAVRDPEGVRLISLEGSPGQGKTRIVQEFYEVIARDQSFWPDSLVPDDPLTSDTRKYFMFPSALRTGGGEILFVWLGVEGRRDSRGAESADLTQTLRFLCGVLPSVFETPTWSFDDWLTEFRGQGKDVAIGAAMNAVGLSFDAFIPAGGVIRLGGGRLHGMLKRRRVARLEASARIIDADIGLDEEFSLAVANASRRRPDMPIILVIEDSHFATEQLCSALLQLLRPDNRKMPSVLVIATGWPELLEDEGNVFGALLADLHAAGTGLSRRSLEPFGVKKAGELIRQRYPGTAVETSELLATHVGGNPHGVRLLLDLRDVRAWVSGDRIAIPPAEVVKLPNQMDSIYFSLWEEIDEDVRAVLAIAALQDEEPVESLTRFMARRLLNHPDGSDAMDSEPLERAINPYRWVRRLAEASELLKFYETERFRLADGHNIRPHRLQAPKLIEEFVVNARADGEAWHVLQRDTRLRLLELHVSAARADESLDQHKAALSIFELAEEQQSRHERLKLLSEAAAWARSAERDSPSGTIWSDYEIENSPSRRIPLSLRIVMSIDSYHDGALSLDEGYEEFLHLLATETGTSAAAVELVAGEVPVAPEREPGPWIFQLVRDWIDAEPIAAEERAWKRLVLAEVLRWGEDGSDYEVAEQLQCTLDDREVTPFLRSRTRRVLSRLLRERLGQKTDAETVLLGDLNELDLDGRERSWSRLWVARWRLADGDACGAERLLNDNLADPSIPLLERAATLRDLVRMPGSQRSLVAQASEIYRQLLKASDMAPSEAGSVRGALADVIAESDPEGATDLLEARTTDLDLPPELRADAYLDLARFQLRSDSKIALMVLAELLSVMDTEDWQCAAVVRAIALKLKYEILSNSTPAGNLRDLLSAILNDTESPSAQRNWAACELAPQLATSDPETAREMLLREADDVSAFPVLRKRARDLISSLHLEA